MSQNLTNKTVDATQQKCIDDEKRITTELANKKRKLEEDLSAIGFAKQNEEIQILEEIDLRRRRREELGLDRSYSEYFELSAANLKRAIVDYERRVANMKRIYEKQHLGGRLTYGCNHGHSVSCDLCSFDHY